MCNCHLTPGFRCGSCQLAELMCDVVVGVEDLGPRFPVLLGEHVWGPDALADWEEELLGCEPTPIFSELLRSHNVVPVISLY